MAFPPPPAPFDPLIEEWAPERPLMRVHRLGYGQTDFNPTPNPGRFRPVHSSDGGVVSTLYASDGFDGALSETVFHELPVHAGPKQLARSLLAAYALSRLTVERPLRLCSLRGHGLRRLGVTHGQLVETGPDTYSASAAWGQAAYDHPESLDGLCWISRQFPGGLALLLFGDRCADVLKPLKEEPPLPLAHGRGFELVSGAASAAGVVLIEP